CRTSAMERLARLVFRRRKTVLGIWLVLTIFGAFSAQQVSSRWLESFTIPGYSAYEADQRMVKDFGSGAQAPLVAVLVKPDSDVTKVAGAGAAFAKAAAKNPGARYSDFFTTGSTAYVSKDRHTTFAEIHPGGQPGFQGITTLKATRATLKQAAPPGTQAFLTGRDALQAAASGSTTGPSILAETLL